MRTLWAIFIGQMRTTKIIFGLLIFPLLSFGQSGKLTDEQINKSGAVKLLFADSLGQAISLAKEDISNGTPFLLLQSVLSPVVYATDEKFENKYKVYYYESGCTGPREKFATEYNKVIFEHLTDHFGRKWKKEARKDVIGLRD